MGCGSWALILMRFGIYLCSWVLNVLREQNVMVDKLANWGGRGIFNIYRE